MTDRTFTSIIVHNRSVNPAGTGTVANYQPEVPVDYSSGNAEGVRFFLAVLGTVGTATDWQLHCKFQFGKWDTTGQHYAGFMWHDLQSEQAANLILEGVDWYGGLTQPVTLTNLIANPSMEVNGTGWSQDAGTGGVVTASRPTDGSIFGTTYRRIVWTTATNGVSASGGQNSSSFDVTAGTRYTASAYVRASKAQRGQWFIRWLDGANATLSQTFGSAVVLTANTWTRGFVTATAPTNAVKALVGWKAGGTIGTDAGAAQWAVGDTMDIDAAMATAGPEQWAYFDGDQAGAAWTGTAGASTSTKTITPTITPGVVARNTDSLPLLVSRGIKGFGRYVRCWIWVTATNPSTDFAVTYSLSAD